LYVFGGGGEGVRGETEAASAEPESDSDGGRTGDFEAKTLLLIAHRISRLAEINTPFGPPTIRRIGPIPDNGLALRISAWTFRDVRVCAADVERPHQLSRFYENIA
jgi:hypothetical protein